MLRYYTAGESHGKALVALIDGFPAGVELSQPAIDAELRRRQGGYGRGGRQRLESDHVEILSGLWRGKTIGSPIALLVANQDHTIEQLDEPNCPRPGHGDLAGAIKHLGPIRGVLERASARETAARVAAGAVARQLLTHFRIDVFGYVIQIGPIAVPSAAGHDPRAAGLARPKRTLHPRPGPGRPTQDAHRQTRGSGATRSAG